MISAHEDHFQKSSPIGASPIEDWTIGTVLKVLYPEVRLRKRVKQMPYLEQVTLRQVLDGTLPLDSFLAQCGREPQCGELSVKRLRDVIESTVVALAGRELHHHGDA